MRQTIEKKEESDQDFKINKLFFMGYHEGSNWQAKKEDEGKPLYERSYTDSGFTDILNSFNVLQGQFHNIKIIIPLQYKEGFRKAIEDRYGKIEGERTILSNCEIIFV